VLVAVVVDRYKSYRSPPPGSGPPTLIVDHQSTSQISPSRPWSLTARSPLTLSTSWLVRDGRRYTSPCSWTLYHNFYSDHYEWICIMLSTDICMSVWMYVCNEMYCDETTNATNIPTSWQYKSICQATPKNSAILAAGRHLEFLMTNIWKCYNFWIVWDIDSRPASFCSGLNSLEFRLHFSLGALNFPSIKWLGG
jgi:hypothetical protein